MAHGELAQDQDTGRLRRTSAQNEIAERRGVAASTIRNTHSGALRNLRADDDLFQVQEAVGKVRDLDRRLALERVQQQQQQFQQVA